MELAKIKLTFAEESFKLEDFTDLKGIPVTKLKLELYFPTGTLLTMESIKEVSPEGTTGNLGEFDSKVLTSLEENEVANRVYTESVTTLKQDIGFNSNAYTRNGAPENFNLNTFPSGVYRAKYTITAGKEYYAEVAVINTCHVDACIIQATDELITINCDNDECNDNLSDIVSKAYEMVALKEGAILSFNNGDYVKASLKLRAADKICSKGCSCNSNCND